MKLGSGVGKRVSSGVSRWYAKWERPLSAAALLAGFVFDIFTLKRVDLLLENMWVVGHLVVVALGILFLNLAEKKSDKKTKNEVQTVTGEKVPGRIHFWLILIIQFTFGGLLSTYLVFYFRSATLATSWPFMLLLAIAFVSNELFKKHYTRLSFQITIFFLSIYSFAIFFVPILVHQISDQIFILSGVVSLIIILFFIALLWYFTRERFLQSRNILIVSIAGVFVIVNALYFTNLIPPIPLSIKDSGIYHSVTSDGKGNYSLTAETADTSLIGQINSFFTSYPVYHKTGNEPVYIYAAVFSPTDLSATISYNWQHYDGATKKWQTASTFNIAINGGRAGGFRTFSYKDDPAPGLWRVDIETLRGQDIGRIRFQVEEVASSTDLSTQTSSATSSSEE